MSGGWRVDPETLRTRMPEPKKLIRETEGEGGVVASPCWAKEPSEKGRGWWVVIMKSHDIEISIHGVVREMVRDPNPKFFFVSCFLNLRDLV